MIKVEIKKPNAGNIRKAQRGESFMYSDGSGFVIVLGDGNVLHFGKIGAPTLLTQENIIYEGFIPCDVTITVERRG